MNRLWFACSPSTKSQPMTFVYWTMGLLTLVILGKVKNLSEETLRCTQGDSPLILHSSHFSHLLFAAFALKLLHRQPITSLQE